MKGKTAFLFLIAVLMLVVSCPFKRLLQVENNIQAFAQQTIKWNDTASQGMASKNTSCCSQKQKIILVKPTISKQQLPGSDFLANQNLHTGFAIHYFLNGTERLYETFAIPPVSTLPLFLQHRRLLI